MNTELGTRLNLSEYIQRMDSSEQDKLRQILPLIQEVILTSKSPRLLSIGSGSGKLEKHLAALFPQLQVVALDYSTPMIDQINGESTSMTQEDGKPIAALLARGEQLPLASGSMDIVLTCSVVHEVASFSDDHELGPTTQRLFAEIARVLKPGGRYVIRDFMQADQPQRQVFLQIGNQQTLKEMDPAQFTHDFLEQFVGIDTENIKKQLGDKSVQSGTMLAMTLADAMEFIVHYSWSKRFADEVQERYTYLPPEEYAQYILDAMHKSGTQAKLAACYAYLQPGYVEHTDKRLSLFDQLGQTMELPAFTGVIAVEKS